MTSADFDHVDRYLRDRLEAWRLTLPPGTVGMLTDEQDIALSRAITSAIQEADLPQGVFLQVFVSFGPLGGDGPLEVELLWEERDEALDRDPDWDLQVNWFLVAIIFVLLVLLASLL